MLRTVIILTTLFLLLLLLLTLSPRSGVVPVQLVCVRGLLLLLDHGNNKPQGFIDTLINKRGLYEENKTIPERQEK